jgi:phosphatidate phosphatase APP1
LKRWLLLALLLPAIAWGDGNRAVLYDGYGSSERFMIEGRVIEAEKQSPARDHDAWYQNLWRSVRTLKNDEQDDVKLIVKIGELQANAVSNEEGFFRISMTPARPMLPGWHAVTVQGKRTRGSGQLLIVPKTNTLGVISDIDDTVLVSNVTDKKKLLEKTFLQNAQQRQTFPGTAEFYRRLLAQNPEPQAAPMFYVSASPRQLADNISAFLARSRYPRGVLVTKLINGNGRDPLLDQQQYKLAKIEAIFTALPWVKFTLIGDDGERDPEIYRTLQEKHPQRIAAIYIRKVHPDPQRKTYAGQLDLASASAR